MPWNYPYGSNALWIAIAITLAVGFALMYFFTIAPPRWRRPIVMISTFLAGAVYVAMYFWPTAQSRGPQDLPQGMSEHVSFWLSDAVGVAGTIAQTLTTFLLGLGIYSLVRIHGRRLYRMQRDWFFSLVMLLSMVAIVVFGYANYHLLKGPDAAKLQSPENWGAINYTFDFLFDGLLQQMDAAMFSIIGFYILSAAYRAFRIRSVEATILLASALIVMLSFMGAVEFIWNNGVDSVSHGNLLLDNFKLTEIANWIRNTFQTPGLRALDFGVGLGALAMGLRLWLSLERGGISA